MKKMNAKNCETLGELAVYLRDFGIKEHERCDIQDQLIGKRSIPKLVAEIISLGKQQGDLIFWAAWSTLAVDTIHEINAEYYQKVANDKADKIISEQYSKIETLEKKNQDYEGMLHTSDKAYDMLKEFVKYIVPFAMKWISTSGSGLTMFKFINECTIYGFEVRELKDMIENE